MQLALTHVVLYKYLSKCTWLHLTSVNNVYTSAKSKHFIPFQVFQRRNMFHCACVGPGVAQQTVGGILTAAPAAIMKTT